MKSRILGKVLNNKKFIIKRLLGMWPGLLYLIWFDFLEKAIPDTGHYVVMHCFLDDLIPFNEYFAIFYFAWFPLMAFVFIWFAFQNDTDYNRMRLLLFGGMLISLAICTIIPNGQNLRPAISEIPNNFFGKVVANLYSTDTCTNVCPSVHVYNSIAACILITNSRSFKNNIAVKSISIFFSLMISLSTMFLKQHSVIDVSCAVILSVIMYVIVYKTQTVKFLFRSRKKQPLFNINKD